MTGNGLQPGRILSVLQDKDLHVEGQKVAKSLDMFEKDYVKLPSHKLISSRDVLTRYDWRYDNCKYNDTFDSEF